MKKKILLLPLDERPCNYSYQRMILEDTDYEVVLPPKNILSKKKIIGDINAMQQWLLENAKDCFGAVISIDTLVYSGILPSRLHSETIETLENRLSILKKLKDANPDIILFAFNLIMRCPQYSSSDEEPDYYKNFGREIFRYGDINHKISENVATDEDIAELCDIKKRLPNEFLNDFVERRKKNIEINKHVIKLANKNIIDFLIIPQDDSSPYGFTAIDQQTVRDSIKAYHVALKAYMYPDADAVENTLIARLINKDRNVTPLVYIKYASAMGDVIIPPYEDRLISETIKYHIIAAGGLIASSVSESDIVLMINSPGGKMLEHSTSSDLPRSIAYEANRNMIEQIEYAKYAMNYLNKKIAFADVAYANGGDPALLDLLKESQLLYKLSGYAGWNTNSNTLGTCIASAMIYSIFGMRRGHEKFLALRYIEDIGYMAFVRKEVCVSYLPAMGLDYFKLDGENGKATEIIKEKLQKFADENISDKFHKVKITKSSQPWNRMFETEIEVDFE